MSLHVNFEVYDFFFHEKSIHYISNSIGPSTHISSWTSSKDLIQCWRFRNLNIIRVISEHVGGSCWLKLQKRKKTGLFKEGSKGMFYQKYVVRKVHFLRVLKFLRKKISNPNFPRPFRSVCECVLS